MAKTKAAIGIDLGGTTIKLGIVNPNGKIIKRLSIESGADKGPDAVIRQIIKGVNQLMDDSYILIGIGIGSPGTISIKKGTVQNPPNFPGWGKVHLGNILRKEFKCKVMVENDANAAAVGELIYGSGKKHDSFIMITLGTGVGGGIIFDRKIFRGETGGAGELGHVSIDTMGRMCKCGSLGCIESYIGCNYLIERVKDRLDERKDSKLYKFIKGDFALLTPELIHTMAEDGCDFSQSVIIDTGTKLGYAIASIVNVLDITTIILGGGIAGFGKCLIDATQASCKERVMKPFQSRIIVKAAKLKNNAGIKGASALVYYKRSDAGN
jgi:glucokinase